MFVDWIKFSVYFYKNFLTRFLISWSTPSKIKTNRTQKHDSYKKKRIKTGGHLIICLEEHIAHIVHIDYLVKILMEKYDTTRFSKTKKTTSKISKISSAKPLDATPSIAKCLAMLKIGRWCEMSWRDSYITSWKRHFTIPLSERRKTAWLRWNFLRKKMIKCRTFIWHYTTMKEKGA